MQQQQHVEKCAQEIRLRLEKAAKSAVSVDVIKEGIERAFNEITRSLESLSMDLESFNILTVALADLKHTLEVSICSLFKDFNVLNNKVAFLETEVNSLKLMVTELQDQSSVLDKMHLISDLFTPMFAKFQSNVREKQIMYNVQTKQCLDQLKNHFRHGNDNNSNSELLTVVNAFEEVAAEYGTNPLLAIDYLVKKKHRNESVHFNRRFKEYAKATAPTERDLSHFLSFYPAIDNQFLIHEVQSLNPLFCRVCQELSLST
jgi:hypothetical protein